MPPEFVLIFIFVTVVAITVMVIFVLLAIEERKSRVKMWMPVDNDKFARMPLPKDSPVIKRLESNFFNAIVNGDTTSAQEAYIKYTQAGGDSSHMLYTIKDQAIQYKNIRIVIQEIADSLIREIQER